MFSNIKKVILFVHLSLLVIGVFFVLLSISLDEFYFVIYSACASFATIMTAIFIEHRFTNWLLWFTGFYFLLFPLGSVIGLLVYGFDFSAIDFPSTFVSSVSPESRSMSFLLSGLGISFLGVLFLIWPPKFQLFLLSNDKFIENIGVILYILSLPFVMWNNVYLFNTFGGNRFYELYSSEALALKSVVPYISFWLNLNTIGFYLFLASVPSRKKFICFSSLFLMQSLVGSLSGVRILFIIPLAQIIWIGSILFPNNNEFKMSRMIIVGIFVLLYAFSMQAWRSSEDPFSAIMGIIDHSIYSVSLAQYFLAIYLDAQDMLKDASSFFLAPLTFPWTYIMSGGSNVGQGTDSAALRTDLVHVLPSILNYNAYIAGAGLGSSVIAEAYQYGILWFFPLLILFYLTYRWFFLHTTNNRYFLLLSPMIFGHFIFSPRDTMFPNAWGILKVLIIGGFVVALSGLLKKYFSKS